MNWKKIKEVLEHQEYIQGKYYKKSIKGKVEKNKCKKKLRYFTTEVEPSPAEANIMSVLQKHRIPYLREVSFEGFVTENGGNYRFDFYFPDKNTIIEYDGKAYHEIGNKRDEIKNQFCKKNKIRLVRISSESYYHIEKALRNILVF